MFKFIHAADIHLDSPLRNLAQYDGAPVEALRTATRQALENLVELALSEQVAFVLIAGDLYDGNWDSTQTGLHFAERMSRLREAGIPVFLIAGNHDAANKMTHKLRLPDNVCYLSEREPQTIEVAGVGVQIHGQGFARRECVGEPGAAISGGDARLFQYRPVAHLRHRDGARTPMLLVRWTICGTRDTTIGLWGTFINARFCARNR